MTTWQIAQMNVATARFPLDDPRIAEFVAQLDQVNALAEASPGFVWRLKSESGNATDIQMSDDPKFIVNMSVWQSVEALFEFAYKSAHRAVMVRRREWFEQPEGPYMVLWWVPAGAYPTATEGLARLAHLAEHGPTPHAFGFRHKFPPPGEAGAAEDLEPDPYCVGWR